ncbi:MAG: hypothetical protein KDE22_19435 [Rhodobacterales bacterium]|nr:hypothetical protein [Rhodobacterales bacterium]
MPRPFLAALFLSLILPVLGAAAPAAAETRVACPSLAQAIPVGACPSAEEIKAMFRATCGVEQNPNARNPKPCDTLAAFAETKDFQLWEVETPDGVYLDYLGCGLEPAQVRDAAVRSVRLMKSGTMTTVACDYGGEIIFGLRRKGVCALPDGRQPTLLDGDVRMDCPADGPCWVTCPDAP